MKNLIIAGTGIKFLSHLTLEVKAVIETSSCVIFLLNEPAIKHWISKTAKKYISLDNTYFSTSLREDAYNKIADQVLDCLLDYDDVCFIIYGHPTIFSSITAEIKKRIKSNGVNLQVMPGISAMDCLFADLNIDPGMYGMKSYDASEFILYDQVFSATSHLILWQISIIGKSEIVKDDEININKQKKAIEILTSKLIQHYPFDYNIVLYIASQYPGSNFKVIHLKLNELIKTHIPRLATLYIPPFGVKRLDIKVLKQLNVTN